MPQSCVIIADWAAKNGVKKVVTMVSDFAPGADAETRDIIQNVYMRKVEKVGGELYNVEFATFNAIKDPIKAAAKK